VDVLNQLNLIQGLAGSLIDSIVETRNRDDARNGINREEIRQKRIATAKEVIAAKKKRYTAGLHASAELFSLGTDVWTNQKERQRLLDLKVSEGEEKKLREFRALRSKVSAIRELNKTHEQLNVSQLKVMVMWFKCNGDLPTPTTRQLLLVRLQTTCNRGDPQEPPLPTPSAAAE
jgi:hypothetical protein